MDDGGRKWLAGGIDREDRVFIDFFAPGPVGPACIGIDRQFAVYVQSRLTAAFESGFHRMIQDRLNFPLIIHFKLSFRLVLPFPVI